MVVSHTNTSADFQRQRLCCTSAIQATVYMEVTGSVMTLFVCFASSGNVSGDRGGAHAYVVFHEPASVQPALQANMSEVSHLCVCGWFVTFLCGGMSWQFEVTSIACFYNDKLLCFHDDQSSSENWLPHPSVLPGSWTDIYKHW